MDICVEVAMMSSHMELPRRVYLEKVLHMFGYIKKHHNDEMVFNPSEHSVVKEELEREEWYLIIYGEVEEELPPNMTEPRGLGLRVRLYVDSNCTRNSVN